MRAITAEGDHVYAILGGRLAVVDISKPSHPTMLGQLNDPQLLYSFDIALSDGYAFVANGSEGLVVFDVRDPASIKSVSQLDTPGRAVGITVVGDHAYVSHEKGGIQVVDISDPAEPHLLVTRTAAGYATDIAVTEEYAIVAAGSAGLMVVDLNDLDAEHLSGYLLTSGSAVKIALSGDYAYAAGQMDGFLIIDISDPENPRQVSHLDLAAWASDLVVTGEHAFIGTPDRGMQVVDVSNHENPRLIEGIHSPYADVITMAGDHAIIGGTSGLTLIDVNQPVTPEVVGKLEVPADAVHVAVDGDYAYIGGMNGLQIVSVDDPTDPQVVASLDELGPISSVTVNGDYGYLTGRRGMQVVDVSEPASPHLLATPDMFGEAWLTTIDGGYAYVASQEGLQIVDITDPTIPLLTGSYEVEGLMDIAVDGNTAYLASGENGLQLVDIGDPTAPRLVGHLNMPGFSWNVDAVNSHVFLANEEEGLLVIDASDPTSPILTGQIDDLRHARGVTASGNLVFVGIWPSGLVALDISEASNPRLVDRYDLLPFGTGSHTVAVNGDLVFAATEETGLTILRFTSGEEDSVDEPAEVDLGFIAYYNDDGHVWLIGADGKDARLVTDKGALTGNFYDHAIRWSPDGRQLAFVRGAYPGSPEEETLLVYDVQSGTLTSLLNVYDIIGFDWSPDSKSLVYSFEGSLWQVDVQSAKTSELVVPERGYPLAEPHWAPGGQYLGFAESVVGEGSGLFATHSPAEQDYQAYYFSLGQYSWSPDGNSLVYDGIVYVDLGEGLSRLTFPDDVDQLTWPSGGASDAAPVMTADGSQIAFLRSAGEEEPYYPWVMNSDGSDQRQVADLPVRSVLQSLSWSPENSVLAVSSRTQEETAIYLIDLQGGEPRWLASGRSPAWQPRLAPIQDVDEPACGTWRWEEVSGEDDRIDPSPISEESWENCRQAFRLSNKTDIYSFGGYTLELTTRPDNAVVEMVPSADPDNRSYLLPPLNSEIHVTPHDAYSEANVFINGEMSLRSFSIDLSLFLLRSGLALIPGTGCVISEEQLLFTALRTSDIVTTAAELTLEGDFVAAKDELQQVLPEFYEKAGDVLTDIGVDCGVDLVQAILKKPLTIVKVGVAYLTWVPVVISDYFKHEGRPIRITLTYAEASAIDLVSVWRSAIWPLISRS